MLFASVLMHSTRLLQVLVSDDDWPVFIGVSDHDLMFSKKAEDSSLQRGEHWPEPVDSRQAACPPPVSAVRQRTANASGKCLLSYLQSTAITAAPVAYMCKLA